MDAASKKRRLLVDTNQRKSKQVVRNPLQNSELKMTRE